MIKKKRLQLACCLLCFSSPTAAFAEPSFDIGTHGYVRSGGGFAADGDGGDEKSCFQAPGASAKYRLGNECETYGEASVYTDIGLGEEAPSFHFEAMANFVGDDFERPNYRSLNQLYLETTGYSGLGDTKFWVGRRFYDRKDIHMNDFFWLNMSNGDGGGVRDIDLGFAKLAYAYLMDDMRIDMNNDGDVSDAVDTKIYQNNHDIRLSDIQANTDGTIELWYNYAHSSDKTRGGVTYDDQNGHSLGIIHTQDKFLGGFNKFSLQYGTGLGRTLTANGLVSSQNTSLNLDDAEIFRATNTNLVEVNEDISVMTALVLEDQDMKEFDGTDQTWFSAGVRPYYYFTDNIRGVAEIGFDHVKNDRPGGRDGSLWKGTLAAELAPSRGAFVRPVLRAYVTGATWSDDFRGAVGSTDYANDTSGLNFGIQVEYWW